MERVSTTNFRSLHSIKSENVNYLIHLSTIALVLRLSVKYINQFKELSLYRGPFKASAGDLKWSRHELGVNQLTNELTIPSTASVS